MTPDEAHLIYKFKNTPVQTYPFPHIYIEDIFPWHLYQSFLDNWPDQMVPIKEARPVSGYDERFVCLFPQHLDSLSEDKREFWKTFTEWFCSGRFANATLQKFHEPIVKRVKKAKLGNEAMLMEDITGYSLGPHTDSPHKVVSALFYLPEDYSQPHLGTSIYVPNNSSFKCEGGPHYGFNAFTKMYTMPFLPNSLFCFCKTDNSFHGVEPITEAGVKRRQLLFDVRVTEGKSGMGT